MVVQAVAQATPAGLAIQVIPVTTALRVMVAQVVAQATPAGLAIRVILATTALRVMAVQVARRVIQDERLEMQVTPVTMVAQARRAMAAALEMRALLVIPVIPETTGQGVRAVMAALAVPQVAQALLVAQAQQTT